MLSLLLLAFVAGVLTIAAPCVLPLLPVIVGGSAARSAADGSVAEKQWYRPVVIAASLAVSVVLFTLILRATTALLGIPDDFQAHTALSFGYPLPDAPRTIEGLPYEEVLASIGRRSLDEMVHWEHW
jgi:hypothetical protein